MKTSANFLDGFYAEDLIVFGDDGRPKYVSCGYSFEAPSLENASLDLLNEIEAGLRGILRLLPPEARLQVGWSLSSDCSQALLHYYDQSHSDGLNPFAKRERSHCFARCARLMEENQLRFQKVNLYVSIPFSGKGDFDLALKAESQKFDRLENEITVSIQRLGGKIKRMKNADLFRQHFQFCNPSQVKLDHIGELYDPSRSLMANVLTGDAVAASEAGLIMDSHHFGTLILKALPQATYSGLMEHVTSLPIRDFGITLNITPLDSVREIEREEAEIEKLKRSLHSGKQQRSVAVLEQRMIRVQRLAANTEVPFRVQIIIRAWDTTRQGLESKLGILKSAVTRMQNSRYYAPRFSTTTLNYFRAGFPGWVHDSCQDFCHLIGDAPLANLLPISGSPEFGPSEAIYEGANGNLIGIDTFVGEAGNEAPQHALVCGKSGSGKSCVTINLLIQTAGQYDMTVIVDNGMSYGTYARTVDPKIQPILIKPGGGLTLNYLDLDGRPLDAQHFVDAVAVTLLMAGIPGNGDAARFRQAMLSRCLNGFYRDFAQDWLHMDADRIREVRRYAAALQKMNGGNEKLSLLEQHHHFHQWAASHEQEAEALFQNISEPELHRIPAETIIALSYAFIPKDDAPTHSDFQQWLELESMGDSSDKDEIGHLAILLKAWCADGGMYGGIFDGISSVEMKGKIIHLELGQIPDSAPDLRAIAALVITNHLRNVIQRLPRNVRKRVVFEELGSLLAIPGGGRLVCEFMQTMRKFNCWVVCVMQQMDVLARCGSAIMGNIRLAILMKQTSPQEVKALVDGFELPESAVETLADFPEPTRERGAPFLCWRSNCVRPEIVTGFHLASPEMLYVSSSSGSHFEQRQEALSRYDDVLIGIIAEAEKTGR